MALTYHSYSAFLADTFGVKVQKLPVDIGSTCPNRDGTVGRGGCIYCNNAAFVPGCADRALTVEAQIERGKTFFAARGRAKAYIAYFQGHTPTHTDPVRMLDAINRALACDGVMGVAIGTRPDAMPQALLDGLAGIARRGAPVIVEYGAESSHDDTLRRVGRGHTWQCVTDAVERTAAARLKVGLHLINGLPGETRRMMLATVDRLAALPVDTVKFHHLQIVKGTPMARMYADGSLPVEPFTVGEYAALCADIVERLRPGIAVERWLSVSPPSMVVAPRWGISSDTFMHMLGSLLEQRRRDRTPNT